MSYPSYDSSSIYVYTGTSGTSSFAPGIGGDHKYTTVSCDHNDPVHGYKCANLYSQGGFSDQCNCYSLNKSKCSFSVAGQTVNGTAFWTNPDGTNDGGPFNYNMNAGCQFSINDLMNAENNSSNTGAVLNYLTQQYPNSYNVSNASTGYISTAVVQALSGSSILPKFCALNTTSCNGGSSSCLMFNSSNANASALCSEFTTLNTTSSDSIKNAYCGNQQSSTGKVSTECGCILRTIDGVYNTIKNASSGNPGCWWNACKDATPNSGILADSTIVNVGCPSYCTAIENFVATNYSTITVNGDLTNNISCDFSAAEANQTAATNAANANIASIAKDATSQVLLQQEYNQQNQTTWQQYKYYILIGCSFAFLLILILLLYWLGRRQNVTIDNQSIYNRRYKRKPLSQVELLTGNRRESKNLSATLTR